jgi:CubicO group peptidase (beta-lactamase class C family)
MNTKFLRILLIAATLSSVSFATAADGIAVVQPEEVGFSSEQLSKVESYFASRVEKGEIAGMVTLVARHGKIAHFSAVGYQDAEQEIPMERDTLFRVYSMTKPIVSTALMMLYQDGLFQMNDPLSKFIPEFADLRVLRSPNGPLDDTVAMEREPTVQDILRHTAGFSHCLGNSDYDKACVELGLFSTETSLEEMMTALSNLPLMNQPGSQWRYSVGPDVALRLVEIISGMSADDYLEQKMFEPLGMNDTGYVVNSDNAIGCHLFTGKRTASLYQSTKPMANPLAECSPSPGQSTVIPLTTNTKAAASDWCLQPKIIFALPKPCSMAAS